MELQAKSTLITQGRQAECTFHPKINDNSEKAVKVLRGPESVDRLKVLYKQYNNYYCISIITTTVVTYYNVVVPVECYYSTTQSHHILSYIPHLSSHRIGSSLQELRGPEAAARSTGPAEDREGGDGAPAGVHLQARSESY